MFEISKSIIPISSRKQKQKTHTHKSKQIYLKLTHIKVILNAIDSNKNQIASHRTQTKYI